MARPLSTCPSIREETSQKAPAQPRSLCVLPAMRSAQLLHWPQRAPSSGSGVITPGSCSLGRKHSDVLGSPCNPLAPNAPKQRVSSSCALTDEPVPGARIKSVMVIQMVIQTFLCIPASLRIGF
uniref:Uncharacterized protein n=1 Tax=Pipistrellus kuhlii TaxID=59472 RepID=A0A7J7VBU4_PIPKU|nr:hypothetical protein mPipKuh1_008516 [Pipistrellus kuhlii]